MRPVLRLALTTTLAAFLATGLAAFGQTETPKLKYPPTTKGDVVDDYHGTRISDPYRWMEDLDSKEVADWIAAQNALTFGHLAKSPMRAHFQKRITALWNYPKTSLPVIEKDGLFYRRNAGTEQQAPLYLRKSLTAPPQLLFDPNKVWPKADVAFAQY